MPSEPTSPRADRRVVAVLRAWAKAGITDSATVRAFRLDAVDAALIRSLPLGPRRGPRSRAGLLIPTFDPGEPEKFVGVVRVQDGQRRHGFLGSPAGIAGPASISTAEKVVLADAPLLALRLHQAGVQHVALIEEPAVLRPLAAWLRQRMVVLASYRHAGTRAMLAELPPDRRAETAKVVLPAFEGGSEVLAELGVDPQRLLTRRRRTVSPFTVATIERIADTAFSALNKMCGRRRSIELLDTDARDLMRNFRAGITDDRAFYLSDLRFLAAKDSLDSATFPWHDAQHRVVGLTLIRTGWPRLVRHLSDGGAGVIANRQCWERPGVVDAFPADCIEWSSLVHGAVWVVPDCEHVRAVARVAAKIGVRRIRLHGRPTDRVTRAIRAAGIRIQRGASEADDVRRMSKSQNFLGV